MENALAIDERERESIIMSVCVCVCVCVREGGRGYRVVLKNELDGVEFD